MQHSRCAIAVPAKDEERYLPGLFAALARQSLAFADEPLPIVLLLNNCSDGSLAAARAAQSRYATLSIKILERDYPSEASHVGSARREAMEYAANMIGEAEGVILTTDADAVPDPHWVARNLDAIDSGGDLVGGHIIGNPAEEAALGEGFVARARQIALYTELCDQLASLLDPQPHDPWPRHHDHTGASLAVRTSVYRAVGGMSALACREDVDFVERVVAKGYKLVHPLTVTVTVSARTQGRAAGGMADCITEWLEAEAGNAPILVEHPSAVEARLIRARQTRAGGTTGPFQNPDLADLPVGQAITVLRGRIAQLEGAARVA